MKTSRFSLVHQRFCQCLAVVLLVVFSSGSGIAADAVLKTQKGFATYYAKRYHGRKTASGESFNRNSLMAAHRSWPFGTLVRVTNPKNGRSVNVRIVDRLGKRAKGVIDLSRQAAARLGFRHTGEGKVQVKLEVLKWGKKGSRM